MIKHVKIFIIGLSSFAGIAMSIKMVSFPDEKLTTEALKESPEKIVTLKNNAPVNNEIASLEKVTKTKVVSNEKAVKPKKTVKTKLTKKNLALVERVIQTGLNRIGTAYIYGGITEKGFDCSGFVHYVFKKYDIDVPHSSKLLAETGKPVSKEEVRKGDILIFTGTNVNDRTPGHVGIVISQAGETLRFVHSSSNGGVKISQVDGTNYERRFLDIRRVL